MRTRGPAALLAPRKAEYDLTEQDRARDTRPDTVIHLAATVGGIGANRANPGLYFYENAVMGIYLMEEARLAWGSKFVCAGTICAYPKFTPGRSRVPVGQPRSIQRVRRVVSTVRKHMDTTILGGVRSGLHALADRW